MNRKHKFSIIVIAFVIAVVGYYAYEECALLNTQEYLKTSLKHETTANDYLNQANAYENKSDYANAAIMCQKSSDEISNALNSDNSALVHANGIYKDYIDNDIRLLQTTSKLIDFQLYLDHEETHDLNPGQEQVTPNMLIPYINQLKSKISVYNDKEDEIITSNPDKFKFLN